MTRRDLFCTSFSATPALWAQATEQSNSEKQIFTLVNAERRKRGLHPLEWDEKLAEIARKHSTRMAEKKFFSHVDPSLGDLQTRLARAHITWLRCAENLFQEQGYASVVEPAIAGWLQSPGHLANLLGPDYTKTGLGVSVARSETFYVTQVFIKPQA